MKVSVITVSFNSESTIESAIKSVLGQTYKNIEYIIVDGLSTDSTPRIIGEFGCSISRVISEKDNGIYDAMNKGVAASTGDIVTFLNSDDVFADTRVVEDAVALFERNDHLGVTFGDVRFVRDGAVTRYCSSRRFKPWKLRFGWMPPHPGSFARRDLYENYGEFSLEYKISADYELFVRWLTVQKIPFERFDRVLVDMTPGGVSTASVGAVWELNKEIVKACRANGVYTNLWLILLKIPMKLIEVTLLPKLKRRA